MPATHTDLDHTVAHARGGSTALDNLGVLCRHHHRAKHRGGWTLDQPQPGVFVWTSPARRTFTTNTTANEEEANL
ncbi:HNH endonuclease [Pseudofrankia inefficax]|uniref:HNH endonuclease n=1 Tax=Pseudofrankia inefficax (strain DSM 45817 / CECT 9037 / DDB 130130 / EuI1c) TaxID=298654 RepID=UPI0003068F67|nr:HNH endonuclease signature motif containing protein [Pseudofrankia inefficax]